MASGHAEVSGPFLCCTTSSCCSRKEHLGAGPVGGEELETQPEFEEEMLPQCQAKLALAARSAPGAQAAPKPETAVGEQVEGTRELVTISTEEPSELCSNPNQSCSDAASPASPSRVSIRSVLSEQHGTAVVRPADVVKLLLVVVAIGAAVWAIQTQQEHLVTVSKMISSKGIWGHAIFFLLFLWVGLPIGYNWSTLVVLVGFSYGWIGLVDVALGTAASAVLCYFMCKRWLTGWTRRRLLSLSLQKQLYIQATVAILETRRAGIVMQIVLRAQPVATFGLTNAFFGVMTDLPIPVYCSTTLVGMTYGTVTMMSVGLALRSVGSLSAALASGDGRLRLAVQVGLAIFILFGLFAFLRYLTVKVLPNMVDEDAEIEVSPMSSPTASPRKLRLGDASPAGRVEAIDRERLGNDVSKPDREPDSAGRI